MKNELIRSLQEKDVSEDEELDEQAEKATNQEEAIPVVQDYEKIVRSKIKFFWMSQENLSKFKDPERFREMMKELSVRRL